MKNPAAKTAGYLNVWNYFFIFAREPLGKPTGNALAIRFRKKGVP